MTSLRVIASAALFLFATVLHAEEREVKIVTGTVADDLFVAGEMIDIDAAVEGDIFAAGGEISALGDVSDALIAAGGRLAVGSRVTGDVVAAGGEIDVTGPVGDNLVLAGGAIRISAPVAGKAIIAGGDITLDRAAATGDDAWLAGGKVTVRSDIGGTLKVRAGEAVILGGVAGDANISADTVIIGPGARIEGALLVRSEREPVIDPGAVIEGGVTYEPRKSAAEWGITILGIGLALLLLPLAFCFVLGLVALLVAFGYIRAIGSRVVGQPLGSFGLGVLVLFGAPPLFLFLMMTIIGIPFAILGFALYVALIVLGVPLAVLGLTLRFLERGGRSTPSRGKTLLAYIAALIVLGLLACLPFLGWIVIWVLLAAGMGAILLALGGRRRVSASPAAS